MIVKGNVRDADAMAGGEWQIHGNEHLTADETMERSAGVATRWVLHRARKAFRMLEQTHETCLEESWIAIRHIERQEDASPHTPLPCDLPEPRPAISASCIFRTNLHTSGHSEYYGVQIC